VLVLDGGRLAGIFTERDVLRRVVAGGLDPAATPISAVMSAPVLTCPPSLSVDDCATFMTTNNVRHVPVQGDDGLIGLVSIRDVLGHKVSEQQATLQQMNQYLYDVR
jgi:IMP dehydrogenase